MSALIARSLGLAALALCVGNNDDSIAGPCEVGARKDCQRRPNWYQLASRSPVGDSTGVSLGDKGLAFKGRYLANHDMAVGKHAIDFIFLGYSRITAQADADIAKNALGFLCLAWESGSRRCEAGQEGGQHGKGENSLHETPGREKGRKCGRGFHQ